MALEDSGFAGSPPAGGLGRPAGPAEALGYDPAPPPRTRALVTVLVILGCITVVIATMAVLAVVEIRRFIRSAKTAEARFELGAIARRAVSTYEGSPLEQPEQAAPPRHGTLCPSSAPVPANFAHVREKYQSTRADWADDPGWRCLGYARTDVQHFQYQYVVRGTAGFSAIAHGDLDADGIPSTFELRGDIRDGRLTMASSILETLPEE